MSILRVLCKQTLLWVLFLSTAPVWSQEQPPVADSSDAISSETATGLDSSTQTALLAQIDSGINRIKSLRDSQGGSSQSSTLDLALNMLELSKARILGQVTDQEVEPQMALAIDTVQAQINHLKIIAADLPSAELLLGQLRQTQDRLNLAKNQFENPIVKQADNPEINARVEAIFESAQQRLDQARIKALLKPNNTALLKNLDDAQTQLDTARLSYETRGDAIQ